jgi:AraC-like DNA-binding protein
MLAGAASRLGIRVDLNASAPTRRRFGADKAVPVDEYCALARSIFSHPKETLGIELAETLPLEAGGVWGAMLRSSETFGSMLCRAERYMRLFFRYTRLRLEPSGHEVAVRCLHPDPSPLGRREQMICLTLGRFLVWGRTLSAENIVPARVTMRWAGPRDKAKLEKFFGCPIRFRAAEDGMFFRAEAMGIRLLSQAPELTDLLEKLAAESIRKMTADSSIAERVLDALRDGLPSTASENTVACELGITVRTLRRRLAQRNVSFRELLASCRRERAQSLLLDRRLSVTEVSYALGYAEPTNFYRAFRGWTGLSPAKWRSKAEGVTSALPPSCEKRNAAPQQPDGNAALTILNGPVKGAASVLYRQRSCRERPIKVPRS